MKPLEHKTSESSVESLLTKKKLQNLEMHSLHRNAYLACKEAIIVEGTTTSNQTVRMWLERRVCWPCHELCSINLSHLEAWDTPFAYSYCASKCSKSAESYWHYLQLCDSLILCFALLSQEAWHDDPGTLLCIQQNKICWVLPGLMTQSWAVLQQSLTFRSDACMTLQPGLLSNQNMVSCQHTDSQVSNG